MEIKRIIVDLDGVAADFESGFYQVWTRLYPGRFVIPPEQRTTFKLLDQYPEEHHPDMVALYTAAGFIRNLPPMPGAVEALRQIVEGGYTIRICTSPLTIYQNCVEEKYAWVEQYFGEDWVKRIIMTKDKTEVRADMLIDDRPQVEGDLPPVWEHIIFDQPYNQHVNKRRLNHDWSNWQELFVPECSNWIQAGSADGRGHAKDNSH